MLLLCAEQKALVTYNRVESRCSAGQGCCCPGQEGRVVRATGRMLYVTRTVMRVLLRRILELAPYWSLRLYHVNGGQGLTPTTPIRRAYEICCSSLIWMFFSEQFGYYTRQWILLSP